MTISALRFKHLRAWATFAFALAACSAKYPEGTIACTSAKDCPGEWSCRAPSDARSAGSYCFSAPGSPSGSSTSPSKRKPPMDASTEDAGSDAGPGGTAAPPPRAGSDGMPRGGAGGQGGRPPAPDRSAAGSGSGSDTEEDAGPDGPACGDTQSDPNHCGQCGHVCALADAEAACTSGRCVVKACASGFADCDADAANGCETSLDSSSHCGACGVTCETDSVAIRACNAGSCAALQLAVGEPEPVGLVNGSLGGDVYAHMCPPGEVITGLEIAISQEITYGFKAKCAPVSLTGTWDEPRIVVGASYSLPSPVGSFDGLAIEQADCPPNTVVTGTSGALIQFDGETRDFIKTVLLACSRVGRVAPSFVFVPDRLVPQANSPIPGDGSYSESCGPDRVLTGFTGYAGAAVDGLQAHCSPLSLLATSSISSP